MEGKSHPHTLDSVNNTALFLLTREPAERRDPTEALDLSLEANRLTDFGDPAMMAQ